MSRKDNIVIYTTNEYLQENLDIINKLNEDCKEMKFCEENNLMSEFCMYREKVESEYVFCAYLKEYIEFGLCYDMQIDRKSVV